MRPFVDDKPFMDDRPFMHDNPFIELRPFIPANPFIADKPLIELRPLSDCRSERPPRWRDVLPAGSGTSDGSGGEEEHGRGGRSWCSHGGNLCLCNRYASSQFLPTKCTNSASRKGNASAGTGRTHRLRAGALPGSAPTLRPWQHRPAGRAAEARARAASRGRTAGSRARPSSAHRRASPTARCRRSGPRPCLR